MSRKISRESLDEQTQRSMASLEPLSESIISTAAKWHNDNSSIYSILRFRPKLRQLALHVERKKKKKDTPPLRI